MDKAAREYEINNPPEKLNDFLRVIIDDGIAESRQILAKLKDARMIELSTAERQMAEEFDLRTKNEIRAIKAESSRIISRKSLELKRALSLKREELIDSLFNEVASSLLAYTRTDGYRARLRELCTSVTAVMKDRDVTVYLRPDDMPEAQSLQPIFNGKVEFQEGSFSLGGLKAESQDKRLSIDETFDSALSNLRKRFGQLSILKNFDDIG